MGHARKKSITFMMTTQCDLNCTYCYSRKANFDTEYTKINLEFAKKGIDDFFKDGSDYNIRFYGVGEPTLEFNRMKAIRKYAYKTAGERLTVELQTNGCFSTEIRDWIIDNVDILWVSFDGPAEIQNKQRPRINGNTSFKTVEKNLRFLLAHGAMDIGVRTTLTEDTITRQVELVEYFHSLGIKNVSVEPVSSPINQTASLIPSAEVFAEFFAEAYQKASDLNMTYLSLTMVNFDEEVGAPCRSCIPTPHLTTDGYVSCCDYGVFGSEGCLSGNLQNLIYGKYDFDTDRIFYDSNAIEKIQSRCKILKETICKDCSIFNHCAGGCMGEAINVSGDFYGVKEYSCQATQRLWKLLPKRKELFSVLHS